MKLTRCVMFIMLISSVAIAEDIKIVGSIKHTIKLSTKASSLGQQAVKKEKEIALLNIELSKAAQQKIQAKLKRALGKNKQILSKLDLPNSVQLGMGNVPVLDQGMYGTCAMFANVAAVDAVLNKGDYVSSLCALQLSTYLEGVSYEKNYWNGSTGPKILNELTQFGLVSRDAQAAIGCGGLTEYPDSNVVPETGISMDDYHQISEPMDPETVGWSAILDSDQFVNDKIDSNVTLNAVKKSLNAGDRLTFGILLIGINEGVVGAVGKYHTDNDTWVLAPSVVLHFFPYGGHEMVITGYNDAAVAVDDLGFVHKGILTLRNSWSAEVGDQGNFYMSYDYFKALTMEVQRIRHIVESDV